MDEGKPVCSIIIPVRNEERSITKCLDTILSNDYPKDRIEIIVVDGQSDDETLRVLQNFVTSLPVKTFEYMACPLPMIISNFPYWKKIFGGYALFANPYDTKDIAEKILYLLDNSHKAKKLSNNGRKLVEEKYSWEAEQRKLLDIYEKVLR